MKIRLTKPSFRSEQSDVSKTSRNESKPAATSLSNLVRDSSSESAMNLRHERYCQWGREKTRKVKIRASANDAGQNAKNVGPERIQKFTDRDPPAPFGRFISQSGFSKLPWSAQHLVASLSSISIAAKLWKRFCQSLQAHILIDDRATQLLILSIFCRQCP